MNAAGWHGPPRRVLPNGPMGIVPARIVRMASADPTAAERITHAARAAAAASRRGRERSRVGRRESERLMRGLLLGCATQIGRAHV